jgi:hypothetical protein
MFLKANMKPNEVKIVKLIKTDESHESNSQDITRDPSSEPINLSIQGISPNGEAVFKFINKNQDIN